MVPRCIQVASGVAALVVAGCASVGFPASIGDDTGLLGPDGAIEVSLGPGGVIEEVEFHVPPAAVPDTIRSAAEREIGPGPIVGAEKEYVAGRVHWEVTKKVGDFEHEVLFDETGKPVVWELEVDPAKAPSAVIVASERAIGGSLHSVEEIRDASKALKEYHVKRREGEVRWKLVLSSRGEVLRVSREVDAEIEVPVR